MSAPSSSRSLLLRLAKWILVVAGLVIGIWVCVLLWWQSSQRQITSEDVLIYLVALPLAALAGFAGINWLRTRRKDSSLAPVAPAPADTAVVDHAHTGKADSNGLPVVAAWAITSAATHLNDFHTALTEKKIRPQPDAALLDDYGFPILAGRVQEIDTSVVASDLERVIADNPNRQFHHGDTGREGFLRAMTLAKLLMDQLSAEWPLIENAAAAVENSPGLAILRGAEPASIQTESRLHLQLKFIIPADFSPAEQLLALSYLLQQTSALPFDREHLQIEIVPASDEPTALLLAEKFRAEALLAAKPQALLLLACDSGLCSVITERWQMDNRLFGSSVPQGLMPGEAAFAILCVNEKALTLTVAAPACKLQPVVHGRRAEPAGSSRKTAHATLDAVVGAAIAAAGISNEELNAIACDADHRSNRVLECIGAMLAHTPHLDAIEDRLSTNEICGHTGAASNAGGWVAGIAHVIETGRPVLLLNVSHAVERAAAVLLPVLDQPRTS